MTMSVDHDEVETAFKAAMRRMASTVTIVTAGGSGRRHGMTATSVTSLSMDPPCLIVCVNQNALLHAIMMEAPMFCVNVLHWDQAPLSQAFSGGVPADMRFGLGDWSHTADGTAYLVDAQANLFCRKVSAAKHATHTIFIGEVERVGVRESVAPLVYQDRTYCVARAAV